MTPNELYAMTPESVSRCLREYVVGCYFNHFPEVSDDLYFALTPEMESPIEIHVIKHFNYDHRRYWRIATIWLDDKPVMIIRNAGREGDDFASRHITDVSAYRELCKEVDRLVISDTDYFRPKTDIYDPERPIENLDYFYSQHLDGPFESPW